MTSRRDYLRLAALAAAAGCTLRLPGMPFRRDPELRYGVQIAGVRREASQDLARLLRTLREIGFTEVELYATVYHYPAATLRQMVADAGLHAPAGHFVLSTLETKLDYARELGLKYIVAMLPRPSPESLDQYRVVAAQLNKVGTSVREHGMEFASLFHNHEFLPQNGSSGFEELMKHTDPALVHLEVDIYWVVQAGLDPVAFLRKYKDRVKLLHLKDRLAGFPTSYTSDASSDHSTELGKGTIPWSAILKQARHQRIRYAFLDYDRTTIPILDSFRQSFNYLKTLRH
ncbi:MAG: sugar phosphate isomerase/epimerase [Granulicella sp.]